MKQVKILDIPFAKISQDEAIDVLESWVREGDANHVIVTPNPEGVMQARRNPDFAHALKNAELSLADGTGVLLASYLGKEKLPGRVRGVDTIHLLLQRLSQRWEETKNNNGNGFSAYFLGGKPGVADDAKVNMEAKYPGLSVVGLHHGFFSPDDNDKIITEINRLSPDILLVCTGMPRAEIWADRNKNILNTRLTLCLGGTLDVMSGGAKMAPAFLRKIGLEWFYRLICEPSRAKRMMDIPRFIFAVILNRRNIPHERKQKEL